MAFDRRQRGTFKKTFEEYAATRVGPARIKRAKAMMIKHGSTLSRVEQRFGVPAELVVAIWTMETDNGADMGKLPVIRTLATLAHDCRRTDLFQKELMAALQIVQRGDLPVSDMIGAYAGEIGQTQFLPSSYIKYGVDFDGNGHVDLRHSVPDVLASTANLLKTNGWKPGAPFTLGTANFDVMRGGTGPKSIARRLPISPTRSKKKKKKLTLHGRAGSFGASSGSIGSLRCDA